MPRPGTTTQAGYGNAHKRLRDAWRARVDAQQVTCARCGHLIGRGQSWDLGHSDDRTRYTGPEHATCNRAAGAALRERQRDDPRPRKATRW